MTCVAFRGLRGGVGTTSTVAGVAHALLRMGFAPLVIDLTWSGLLRWHFGLGARTATGWSEQESPVPTWHACLYRSDDGLSVLPSDGSNPDRDSVDPVFWRTQCEQLSEHYDWILLDAPESMPFAEFDALAQVGICVAHADAASAILLESPHNPTDARLLITQYDPLSQLQRDIRLLFQHSYAKRMVPAVVHHDEAIAEALANGLPVGAYRAVSLGAQDMQTIATWLLTLQGVES